MFLLNPWAIYLHHFTAYIRVISITNSAHRRKWTIIHQIPIPTGSVSFLSHPRAQVVLHGVGSLRDDPFNTVFIRFCRPLVVVFILPISSWFPCWVWSVLWLFRVSFNFWILFSCTFNWAISCTHRGFLCISVDPDCWSARRALGVHCRHGWEVFRFYLFFRYRTYGLLNLLQDAWFEHQNYVRPRNSLYIHLRLFNHDRTARYVIYPVGAMCHYSQLLSVFPFIPSFDA